MDPRKTEVVLGPPGVGKTTDMLRIVEEALVAGVKPWEIGFISFTRKAAEEGITRACKRFGLPEDQFPNIRTIHSMAFRQLGMRRDSMLQFNHIRQLGRLMGIDFKGKQLVEESEVYGMNSADRLLFMEGLARNMRIPLKKVWEDAMEDEVDWHELDRLASGLAAFKRSRQLVDYNDLLESYLNLDPQTLPKLKVLIIDEGQDLSNLQWDCVELLASRAEVVYVAGDDVQGIYRWSGANVDRFINMRGRSRTLSQSYRVPHSVFNVLRGIEDRIHNKRPREWSSRDEVGQVNWYSSIEEIDISKETWLLLARNGYMLDELEEWCLLEGFSFNSVNRDPLKSPSLQAIKVWEQMRRGNQVPGNEASILGKFLDQQGGSKLFFNWIQKLRQSDVVDLETMKSNGLLTTDIWHQSLTRIPPKERDYYIAARRRGEPLLKEPRIKISTIHAAKGGQADHVLLVTDMSYRCWSKMQENEDEENRVWYVGASRCMKSLNLIMPRTNLNYEL